MSTSETKLVSRLSGERPRKGRDGDRNMSLGEFYPRSGCWRSRARRIAPAPSYPRSIFPIPERQLHAGEESLRSRYLPAGYRASEGGTR